MTDEMTSESAPAENTASAKRGGGFLKIVLVIIVLALIGGGVYSLMGSREAMAVVNGIKIPMSAYQERFDRLEATIIAQGGSATSTEVQTAMKNDTIKNLIDEELVLQAAGKEGIKANEDQINTQQAQSRSSFADEAKYQEALQKQGYTEKTFREFLTRMNIIQQYLIAHVSTSSANASESEIKSLYDQAKAVDKSIQPLSEVRPQVEQKIIAQKQQQLVNAEVEKLRTASQIEILIK